MGRLFVFWPLFTVLVGCPGLLTFLGFQIDWSDDGAAGLQALVIVGGIANAMGALIGLVNSFSDPFHKDQWWCLPHRVNRAARGSALRWGTKGTLAEPDGDKVRVCGYERDGSALWPFAVGKIAETYLGSFDAIEQAEEAYEVTAGFMQDRELSATSDAIALAKALTR